MERRWHPLPRAGYGWGMPLTLSCAFATSSRSHEHARLAEELGYARAWFYDSPALYPDVWVQLCRAAERTDRIGLGPGVLVPSLRHVVATAAAIVGTKLPDNAGEDSVSLLPALLGTATGPVREATVHQSMAGDLAIRQGPWKLVFLRNGRRELYNLQSDLSEKHDLAAANPAIVERMTTLMQSYVDRGRSTAGKPQANEAAISL